MAAQETISKSTIRDVRRERDRQDAQWGGSDHDDEHEPDDWLGFIARQVEKGREEFKRRGSDGEAGDFEVRDRLVKIAALACAGIDSLNRKAMDR